MRTTRARRSNRCPWVPSPTRGPRLAAGAGPRRPCGVTVPAPRVGDGVIGSPPAFGAVQSRFESESPSADIPCRRPRRSVIPQETPVPPLPDTRPSPPSSSWPPVRAPACARRPRRCCTPSVAGACSGTSSPPRSRSAPARPSSSSAPGGTRSRSTWRRSPPRRCPSCRRNSAGPGRRRLCAGSAAGPGRVGGLPVQHRGLRPHRATTPSCRRRARPALDLLDRRRHGLLHQRAPLPRRAASCRPRTPCASRSWSTTSPTTTRSRAASAPFSRARPRSASCPWNAGAPAGADRPARAELAARSDAAAAQPRVPDRRLRLDGRAEQAAAAQAVAAAAGRAAAGRRTAWRSSSTPGASGLVLPSTPGDAQGDDPSARSTRCRPAARPTAAQGIQLAYRVAARELHHAAASTA